MLHVHHTTAVHYTLVLPPPPLARLGIASMKHIKQLLQQQAAERLYITRSSRICCNCAGPDHRRRPRYYVPVQVSYLRDDTRAHRWGRGCGRAVRRQPRASKRGACLPHNVDSGIGLSCLQQDLLQHQHHLEPLR